jgi:4-amino-4-deoxy-L-arabinose transferase-like glycosyltransferase
MSAGSRVPPALTLLIAAALVGVGLRLAFGLGYWRDRPLTRDELEYFSLARSLAAGHGFVYDESLRGGSFEPFGRAPGYPAFLALIGGGRAVVDAVPAVVKIAQTLVGGAGVVLVGLIAGQLAGRRAGALAAVVAAVYPPLVWISAYGFSEALFWPVGLAVAWTFDRALGRTSDAAFFTAAAGLLTGAGILIRPALLLFVPLAVIWLLVRRRVPAALILIAGVAMVVGPWTVRNYVHHGRVVLVASDGGVTFWTGNHPLAIGEGDMAANPALKLANQALRAAHPGLTEEVMEPIYYREAFAWMRANPGDWLALEARKLFYLLVPIGPSYTLHSRLYYAASVLSYGVVALLAIVALARLGPSRGRTPGLWLLVASAVAVCLIFFPQERFRIPIIDPALVVLAGAALSGSRDRP